MLAISGGRVLHAVKTRGAARNLLTIVIWHSFGHNKGISFRIHKTILSEK
jgi:hypothetical protein